MKRSKTRVPTFILFSFIVTLFLMPTACDFTPAYKPYVDDTEQRLKTTPDSIEKPSPEIQSKEVNPDVLSEQRELESYVRSNMPVKNILWTQTVDLKGQKITRMWPGPYNVYFETNDHKLWAVSKQNGNPQWVFTLDGKIDFPPVLVHGLPQSVHEIKKKIEQKEREITKERGTFKPNKEKLVTLNNQLDSLKQERQDLVDDDRVYLIIGTTLYVVDRSFGTQIARKSLPFAPGAAPYATTRDIVIPGFRRSQTYVLSPDTLTVEETFAAQGLVKVQPNYADPVYVLASVDHNVYGYREKGQVNWYFESEGPITTRPLVWNNSVFVGSEDMQLYKLNDLTGNIQWTYYMSYPISETPTISAPNIYVLPEDGKYYSISLDAGELNWSLKGPKEFLLRNKDHIHTINRELEVIYTIDDDSGKIVDTHPYLPFDFILPNDRNPVFVFATKEGVIIAARATRFKS